MEQETDIPGADEQIQEPVNHWHEWEKTPTNSFIYQVQRGRKGFNRGLDNGLQRINYYTYGTHRAKYYLIGADSGVGKTTVGDFMFVLSAWQSAKATGRKVTIYYCSFEISKIEKEAAWVAHYIAAKHKVEMPRDFIMGKITGNYLTDEQLALVQEAYVQVNLVMQDVIFLEDSVNPTAIFEGIITSHYESRGTVIRTKVSAADAKKGKKGYVKDYIPNNPDEFVMLFVDHIGLTNSEMGLNLKETMDRLSRYAIILRNKFNTTIVFLQQFSTDLLAAKRERVMKGTGGNKNAGIAPNRLDFGDSKTTYRDADVVIGLVKPSEFEVSEYQGFNLESPQNGGLGGFFLIMYLMKNRSGSADKKFPLFFNPIAGVCYDMPNELSAMEAWYDKAKQLDELCLQYSPKQS